MNANHSIVTHINKLDTASTIAVAKGLANNAIGKGIYAVVAGIRKREAKYEADRESTIDTDEPEAPVGLETRETPRQRLHAAAKQYVYAMNLINKTSDGNTYDQPQTIPNRMVFEQTRLRNEIELPTPVHNSVAGSAAAQALRGRNQEQLEFMQTWHAEIVLELEGVFHAMNRVDTNDEFEHDAVGEAEDYVASLTGIARYQFMITCVTALVRQMQRLYTVIATLRPGSTLASQLSSELGAIERDWKQLRAATIELESVDSHEILEAITSGRRVRDLMDSDNIIRSLGVDVEKISETV